MRVLAGHGGEVVERVGHADASVDASHDRLERLAHDGGALLATATTAKRRLSPLPIARANRSMTSASSRAEVAVARRRRRRAGN